MRTEEGKPILDERFITRIEGREFVKYPGLLDLGHQKGIAQIDVEPLQFPNDNNGHFAICRAMVVSKEGESFSDVGDASPSNVSSRVAKHLLRMASTRAIARALRSFTNIGMTCLEELADLDDVKDDKHPKKAPKKATKPKAKPAPASKPKVVEKAVDKEEPQEPSSEDPRPRMSEAQKKAIHNLGQRRGISPDDLENMAEEAYGHALEALSSSDASQFIRHLQQAA